MIFVAKNLPVEGDITWTLFDPLESTNLPEIKFLRVDIFLFTKIKIMKYGSFNPKILKPCVKKNKYLLFILFLKKLVITTDRRVTHTRPLTPDRQHIWISNTMIIRRKIMDPGTSD